MIPTAPFGRTGHDSTRLIFGAAALGGMSQERADATLAAVAGWGINHIDTAASYGASEDRLQPWLADHRHEVFLATKTGERRGDAARAELERSLQRMAVDHVDLIQLHNLVEPDEWEVAHGPGGAVEALARARDEGLVRHIGVTGHGLRIAEMHLRSLERFPFDAVLFPYNHSLLAEPAYRADVEALVERCAADGVALQTIKSIARRRWPDDAAGPALRLVRAADRPGRDRPGGALRAVRPPPVPQHDERRPPAAAPRRGRLRSARPPVRRRAGRRRRRRSASTPIFDGGDLERI